MGQEKKQESVDKAEATKEEQAAEKDEGINKAKAEKVNKEKEVPKKSMIERFEENLEEKNPKLSGYWSSFKEVWDETFPDPDKQMHKRMEMRRKIAKEQREYEEKMAEMTPE